jgi:hypothetical protein
VPDSELYGQNRFVKRVEVPSAFEIMSDETHVVVGFQVRIR